MQGMKKKKKLKLVVLLEVKEKKMQLTVGLVTHLKSEKGKPGVVFCWLRISFVQLQFARVIG